MTQLQSICVYCGSGFGTDPAFVEAARRLGRDMARAGVSLVYGGGNVGLMGTIARAVLDEGGHVTGIIPEFLKARELMIADAQELVVVPDMHTRKRLMFEKADAFVALPGGVGTLEELIEQMTWAQLGQHNKPILLANVADFWRPLLDLLVHMRDAGFIRTGFEVNYLVADTVEEVVPMLQDALASRETAAGAVLAEDRL
ncbi:MAG: TIGR00730 family Rossman fold protein [Alsobacter sp.]